MSAVLFYCPNMLYVAEKIQAQNPEKIQLGTINWDRFADGFGKTKIENYKQDVEGRDVIFLSSMNTPGQVFEQLSVIYAFKHYGARTLRIFLPFFPTSTMDRIIDPGEIVTAKTLSRMLSAIPSPAIGQPQIITYDLHDEHEIFYFSDQVRVIHETAIPLLHKRLESISNSEKISIVFPDWGAQKRFGRLFLEYDQIICHKIRKGDERIITIQEGNPEGRICVIVDDLIMTGGTLIKCKDLLLQSGALSVSAYATHGVFPEESYWNFMDQGFENIWITDSCPLSVEDVKDLQGFEVLSLVDHMIDSINSFKL